MAGGPIQLMAFGYGSAKGAEERIMAELDALQGRGVLRLLDFLFVQKSLDGDLSMLDIGDDEDYGAILAGFFPLEDEDGHAAEVDPDELAELASALEPGTAMALVLVEHLWAGGLFAAVELSGGELLSEGFITDSGEVIVGTEAEVLSEAAAVIEAAHAAEAAARLSALRAIGKAASAVEAADRIRTGAAADALAALIEAGIIEEAAADEAADALVEAGLVEAAANQEAGEAVAEAARIEAEAADEVAAAVGETDAVERAEAESLARAVVESEIAQDAAHAAEEKAEVAEADAERRERVASFTGAEKRLLRYLATDLTFALVADKLHISRGAVKSRATAIYKKLGVHSRAEAVEAAKALGVIKG